MEDNGNNVNNSSVLEELQTLNEGITSLNENQEELTEFIIKRDKETSEAQAEKDQKLEEDQAKSDQDQTQQAETYTETLEQISNNVNVTNHLLSGQIFFLGVVVGVLLIKILFDRFSTRT